MKVFVILIITLSFVINKLSTKSLQRIEKEIDFYNLSQIAEDGLSSPLYNIEVDLKKGDIFEGDIILNSKQRKALNNLFSNQRNAQIIPSRLWPNATVHYKIIEADFNADQISAICRTIDDIQKVSCIKFINHIPPEEKNYLTIRGNSKGCFSNVGMEGGEQILNIYPSPPGKKCFQPGSLFHEFLHSLGFFHMQSSVDRDDYVKVVWENILPDRIHNFAKYSARKTSSLGVEYDYESVLHYSNYAFSKNKNKTLIPIKVGKTITKMGQRQKMSDKDILKLNKLYRCENKIESKKIQNTFDNTKDKPQNKFNNISLKFNISGIISYKTIIVK